MTTSGSAITLSSAYSEILSTASGKVILDANGQQQFIDHLGFSTCSGGGENIVPTALVQVTNTTATQTSTYSNVPLAAVSLSIAPVSSSLQVKAVFLSSHDDPRFYTCLALPSKGAIFCIANIFCVSITAYLSSFQQASTPAKVSAGATTSFPTASAPLIVIGNHTITPSRNPIGLPVYNGTIIATSGKGVVGPTGSFNTTNAPAPYLGGAGGFRSMDQWMWAWAGMMIGMLGLVYYL